MNESETKSHNSVDLVLKWSIILVPVLLLVLFYAHRGVILFYPDTKNALLIAENFSQGTFFSNSDLAIKTIYAPLFPYFLSLLNVFFPDVGLGFMIFSTLFLLLNNMILYSFIEELKPSVAKYMLAIILIFFVQHLQMQVFMLFESMMLPLFYLYFHFQFVQKQKEDWQSMVLFNILIAACFFVKYSTLICLVFGGIYDVFVLRKSFKTLVANYLFPVSLIIAWMFFCLKTTGNITGDVFANTESVSSILKHIFLISSSFIFPYAFTFIIVGGFVFSKKHVWLYAILFYLALLLYFDYNGRLALEERLLIPVYLPLVLVIKDLNHEFKESKYYVVFTSFLVLASLFTLLRYAKNYYFWLNY